MNTTVSVNYDELKNFVKDLKVHLKQTLPKGELGKSDENFSKLLYIIELQKKGATL